MNANHLSSSCTLTPISLTPISLEKLKATIKPIATAPNRREGLDLERKLRDAGQGGPLNKERY